MFPNRNNTWPKPSVIPFWPLGPPAQRSPSPQRIRERIPDINPEPKSVSIPETPQNTATPQSTTSSFQNASLGAVLNQNESPGPRHRAPVFHAADELGSDEEGKMEEVPLSDSEDDWEVVRNEGRSERYNPLKLVKKKVEKEVEKAVEKVDQVLKRKRQWEEETDLRAGVLRDGGAWGVVGDFDRPDGYESSDNEGGWDKVEKVKKAKKEPEEAITRPSKRRERTGWLKYFE
ncbi:hypothetical protein FPQ18DRAFT_396950 [Pyronema domesticum]|uniref:Uncharacterized protein n=1 Tax=Pyronema omphalodes (strain CBS 100304) TaxID=1076935 RepID=U4LW05_PYROM|nr:hypothetical protein FPQ18DRAFT_396950 [Pyronema domesticum]CCX33031.1 Protein of unknown function [Pyronema omphalodes CBS 100304]